MVLFYKHFMIQYEQQDDKIIVASIIAHGNYQCIHEKKVYPSLDKLKKDIDNERYGK